MLKYDERTYWEGRYGGGGKSGAGVPAERQWLTQRVLENAAVHEIEDILDVGVGTGELAAQVLRASENGIKPGYTGLDISPSAIRRARSKLPPRVVLGVSDIVEASPVPRDMVLCLNVHYHMATRKRAERLIENVLSSALRVALVLTWNDLVLRVGPLAPHCHYRSFELPEITDFFVASEEVLPMTPHKTLYTLARKMRQE